MWIFLHDCFVSIVDKDCGPDELLVRARRKGDIERLFPRAKVVRLTRADYLYRAVVKRDEIARKIATEISEIDYDNFKGAVRDHDLHDAYMRVWTAMAALQPTKPYSGGHPLLSHPKRKPRKRAAAT